MNNTAKQPDNIIPFERLQAQQAEADPSKTLDLLTQATQEEVQAVLNGIPNLDGLSQAIGDANQQIETLSAQIDEASQKIHTRFSQSFPDLSAEQLSYVTAYFTAFSSIEDIVSNTQNAFPDLDNDTVDSILRDLSQDQDIANLYQTYNSLKQNEKVLLDAKSNLDRTYRNQIDIERARDEFQYKNGILLDQNLRANLNIEYTTPSGSIETTTLKIKGIKPTSSGIQFEVSYTDPITNQPQDLSLSPNKLSNILYNSNAINQNISSPNDYHNLTGLNLLGLNSFSGSLDYVDSNGNIAQTTVSSVSTDSVTLTEAIDINNQSKSTVTFAEFSKWATQHKAMPSLSNDQLKTAITKLPEYIRRFSSVDLSNLEEYSLQPGSTYQSLMNDSLIQIQSLSDETITFTYNDLERTVPNSIFLKTLQANWFVPAPSSSQELVSDDPTDDQSPVAVPVAANDDKEKSDKSDDSVEIAPSSSGQVTFAGKPSFLKVSTYTGLISKALTLNGNIAWVSYSDSAMLIEKIVENIRTSLKISNERAMGKAFKKLPLIGESLARMESAAKGEISKDHKEYLERVGDWPKWQSIASQEQDPVKFFATCSLLKEKGYLPVHQPAFIANVNKLITSNGGFMPLVSMPDPSNGAEVAEQLITFFDKFSEETGTGIEMIEGNANNMKSAISRFKSQSMETFNSQHDFGMCKLHKLVKKYKETSETVDPHEVKGMVLAAIASGNVPTHELIHYLGMVAGMEKNGRPLVSDFSFLDEVKKTFIPATLFMNPPELNEIKSFYKNALSGHKFAKLEKIDAKFENRLPAQLISQLNAFSYISNTMLRAVDKSDDAIEGGSLDDDHGSFALYSVVHSKFHNSYLFQSKTTRMYRALSSKNGKNAIVNFEAYLEGFKNALSHDLSSVKSSNKLYKDEHDFIINSMKNFISLEAGLNSRYESTNLSAPSVGEFKPYELDKIKRSKDLISKVLLSSGASPSDINKILNETQSPSDLFDDINRLFNQVKASDIQSVFVQSSSSSQAA